MWSKKLGLAHKERFLIIFRSNSKMVLTGRKWSWPGENTLVRKIAYKSLKTTKNSHFLRTDHRNVVHENFFRDFGDIICIKNLFRPIRVINRTNSWAIWTRIGEDIDHFSKWPATSPLKKNSHVFGKFSAFDIDVTCIKSIQHPFPKGNLYKRYFNKTT